MNDIFPALIEVIYIIEREIADRIVIVRADVKMTRWLVRLLSQEAGKWSGTSINSGICTVGQ
jgi:hypothetical protein